MNDEQQIINSTIAMTIGQQAIQLAQLKAENQKLKTENDQLKKLVAKMTEKKTIKSEYTFINSTN